MCKNFIIIKAGKIVWIEGNVFKKGEIVVCEECGILKRTKGTASKTIFKIGGKEKTCRK